MLLAMTMSWDSGCFVAGTAGILPSLRDVPHGFHFVCTPPASQIQQHRQIGVGIQQNENKQHRCVLHFQLLHAAARIFKTESQVSQQLRANCALHMVEFPVQESGRTVSSCCKSVLLAD